MTALLSDALGVTILFASIGVAVVLMAAVHDAIEAFVRRGLRRRAERLSGGRS